MFCGNYRKTVRGVCVECMQKRRIRARQKKNIAKIIASISIGIIAIFVSNFIISSNILEETRVISDQIQQIPHDVSSSIEKSTDSKTKALEAEKEVHRLVNIERQKQGLSSLIYDEKLSNIARLHSQDMLERGYFSHDTPEGLDPTQRAQQAGYNCRLGIAENIHMEEKSSITFWDSPETIAKSAVVGWMNSEGHRKNILTSHYHSEGIGVTISSFEIYVTQNFC